MAKKITRIPLPTEKDIVAEILQACEVLGIKPTTFGMMSVGQPLILDRLRKGGNITLDVIRRMREYTDRELARRQDKTHAA